MKSKPAWTLQHYEQQLASENGRLGALAIHDLTINAVLSLSIEDLESDDERLFAFLGLLPRNHFALVEAAAIWQRPISQAEDALERLADVQLIQPEDRSGTNWIGEVWFEIHDLVRLFAAQQLDLPAGSALQDDVRQRVESIGGFYTFAFVKSIEGPEESWREAIQIYEEIVEKLRLLGISEPAAELLLLQHVAGIRVRFALARAKEANWGDAAREIEKCIDVLHRANDPRVDDRQALEQLLRQLYRKRYNGALEQLQSIDSRARSPGDAAR